MAQDAHQAAALAGVEQAEVQEVAHLVGAQRQVEQAAQHQAGGGDLFACIRGRIHIILRKLEQGRSNAWR